jgi:hypothetical protein
VSFFCSLLSVPFLLYSGTAKIHGNGKFVLETLRYPSSTQQPPHYTFPHHRNDDDDDDSDMYLKDRRTTTTDHKPLLVVPLPTMTTRIEGT